MAKIRLTKRGNTHITISAHPILSDYVPKDHQGRAVPVKSPYEVEIPDEVFAGTTPREALSGIGLVVEVLEEPGDPAPADDGPGDGPGGGLDDV